MPNVIDNEELYNVITLGGQVSPGLVTLSGHNRVVNWDPRLGPFMNGSTVAFKNIPLIQFTATFFLSKNPADGTDDFTPWESFAQLIRSSGGHPPVALSIYHPDLAENHISSVVMAEMGGFVYDGQGGATVAVKFQEYRPQKGQSGVPQAKPDNTPAYIKAQMAEIKALVNQYQNMPSG